MSFPEYLPRLLAIGLSTSEKLKVLILPPFKILNNRFNVKKEVYYMFLILYNSLLGEISLIGSDPIN